MTFASNKIATTNVPLNGLQLDPVESTELLGITMRCRSPYIKSYPIDRLSSGAIAVIKARNSTDVDAARIVYIRNFHSIKSYGILVWDNCVYFNDIFNLISQKRTVRAIYNLGFRVSLCSKLKYMFG